MERDWKRAVDFLRLSLDDVNELIAGTGLVADDALLISEGHANTNYRLELVGQGPVVLRIYQREPEIGALESTLAAHLPAGALAPHFPHYDPELGFALVEWRPGRTMESLLAAGNGAEVSSAATDIGLTLAEISTVTFPSAGFLASDLSIREPWPSTLDGLKGYARFLLASELVRARLGLGDVARTESAIEGAGVRLAEAIGSPCLVHGDYKAANLLIHEGRLSAVLDWEFAHSGTWLMSVGQLFRHESTLPSGFEAAFADGVTGAGIYLPPDWRRLGQIIDLLSLLDFLSRPDSGEQLIEDVRALIRRTLHL